MTARGRDGMLLKPELSGLAGMPVPVIAQIKERYKEMVYPGELAAIAADNAVVVPAEQAIHMARNEMADTYGVHPLEFDNLMDQIEVGRPWLTKDRKQVVEVDGNGKASYRLATEADLADGVEYENFDAYKAAQGLADAA
jgi:hypothetical protein